MVFIFRLPPHSLMHYPLTVSLCNSFPPVHSGKKYPLLNSSTSLAQYKKETADCYLKKVVDHLKESLELFRQVIFPCRLNVTFKSERGVEQLTLELTSEIHRKTSHASCVLDALGILQQALFNSKLLLDCVKKLSEDDVQKLKKLKINLLKLCNFLDSILLYYSKIGLNCKLPGEEGIERATKKINKVIRNLKPNNINKLISEGTFTEEDILCSVLGFQDDYAQRLRNVSEEMRNHQTDMDLLLRFVEERYEPYNEENLRNTAAVKRRLQKIGFTENRSRVIATWIGELPFAEHKSLLDWAQIYIENLFKYNIFLNDYVKDFPYKEGRLNEWFHVGVERDRDYDNTDDTASVNVPVINTTKAEASSLIRRKVDGFKANQPHPELYFHGTDHNSAKDILENGIKLDYGRKHCDFSDGTGFYVANIFQHALKCSDNNERPAVVIFRIGDDCLKNGLDLSDRGDDLRNVWKFFQSGRQIKLKNRELRREVEKCDYITGPISGTDCVKQICIKKENMANEVGNPEHIVGIVFLRKEDTR